MNKIGEIEWRRIFLIERLPEPLTRSSKHLQVFDNYISGTPMRLRQVRDPYTKSWSRSIQKRKQTLENGTPVIRSWEIPLNDLEYAAFAFLEGREIRKNRYFHEFGSQQFTFDVYLGPLWGLNIMFVDFISADAMSTFEPPSFVALDVTGNDFFCGENLVEKQFAEAQAAVAQIGRIADSTNDTASPEG